MYIVQCNIVVLNVCIQNDARVLLMNDEFFNQLQLPLYHIIIQGDSFKIYNNTR